MIKVTQKVFFTRGRHGRRRIVDKPPPVQTVPEGRVPRLSKLMALALQFEELIRTRYCLDMTELARLAMVTQPRITQVMNLLHLAPDIQEEILFLPKVLAGRDPIHEKQLRRICQEPRFARQRRMWQVLKRSRMEDPVA
jgi:hypothetical protein